MIGGAAVIAYGSTLLPPARSEDAAAPHVAGIAAAASDLERDYGIVIRYDDANRFVAAPLEKVPQSIEVTAMAASDASVALALMRSELAKYPHDFVRRTLGAVFLCGSLKSYGRPAAGLVYMSGIYVTGRDLEASAEARREFILTLHHELSSLTLGRGGFPEAAWRALLPPGFDYPAERKEAVLAALGTVDDAQALAKANAEGFVNTYGESSLENDFNTYAELAFGDTDKMRALVAKHERMRGKLALFLAFHQSLDPRFAAVFATSGLAKAVNTNAEAAE